MTYEEFQLQQKQAFDDAGVPEELRGWLGYIAYDRAHSGGVEEVFNCLLGLLDGFPNAWSRYIINHSPKEESNNE